MALRRANYSIVVNEHCFNRLRQLKDSPVVEEKYRKTWATFLEGLADLVEGKEVLE